MSLLFDQNISFKVPGKIQDFFPGSKHVSDLRLENSPDIDIWAYAKTESLCIITFDSDFIDISTLRGFPPKIIWLRIGNTSTNAIIERLISDSSLIKDFLGNNEIAFLEIK